MRSTFSLLPYINRSRVKADGTTGILCRITIDGSRPPSVRNLLPPRRLEWQEERDKVRKGEQSLAGISPVYFRSIRGNTEIAGRGQRGDIEEPYHHEQYPSDHPPANGRMGKGAVEETFRRNRFHIFPPPLHVLPKVSDGLSRVFRKEGHRPLKKWTEEFGKAYKAYLKKCKNFGASQTNKCMCWLNRLLYLAVDRDIIRVNPLRGFGVRAKAGGKAQVHQPRGVQGNPIHPDV